jgi:hypothetical protein
MSTELDQLKSQLEAAKKSDAFHTEACAAHQSHIDELKSQLAESLPFKEAWDELFPRQSLGEAQATVETLRERLAECQRQFPEILRILDEIGEYDSGEQQCLASEAKELATRLRAICQEKETK